MRFGADAESGDDGIRPTATADGDGFLRAGVVLILTDDGGDVPDASDGDAFSGARVRVESFVDRECATATDNCDGFLTIGAVAFLTGEGSRAPTAGRTLVFD